jgi:hypothetical protein
MGLIGLTSTRGAPGVTTTALGLALAWHRPVLLVEADVAAGSAILAGYLRGTLPHDRGLRDVAAAISMGEPLDEAINACLIDLPGGRVRLLPGLTSASQAPVVGGAWEPLAAHLRDLHDAGMDVIVDLGRWGARHGPEPLLPYLDLLLLAISSDLPGVHAARGWVPVLRADLDTLGRGSDALRALVVGPGRPYSTREIAAALELPVLGDLAWDPPTAAVLSHGAPQHRNAARAPLGRDLTALAAATAAAVRGRTSTDAGEVLA